MLSNNKNNYLLINWLRITFILLFSMIIIGGLTRLTNSGLSITEWELFKGILPPLNQKSWDQYFELYKLIPQYQISNPLMSLDEFKTIFYWEYIHRILGRIIGIFSLLFLIYFQFIKKLSFKSLSPYYLVFILILFQGYMGWYMVKSGLVNDVTVSHYRLSVHLLTAIVILSIIFWQILNLRNNKLKNFFVFDIVRFPYIFLFFLLLIQVVLGAFVSGLDAGRIYQSWPLMGTGYFPDDFDFNHLQDLLNFDIHSLVQFYHRNLAYIISIYIVLIALKIFLSKDKSLYKPITIVLVILTFQILLGVYTLLSNLNIVLASAHQIFSIILILGSLNLYYSTIK